ncbi:MAG: hypothetical protein IKI65_01590 [Firmicutes bacterium]|nr:hypothetical protein [Bacillota bacterium]
MEKKNISASTIILLIICGCMLNAMSAAIRSNYGLLLTEVSALSGVGYASVSFVIAVSQFSMALRSPSLECWLSRRVTARRSCWASP